MPLADLERRRAYDAEYRLRNADAARERTRLWRLENKERARELDNHKRAANPELYKGIARRASSAFYARNRDEYLARGKAWRRANPDKVRAYSAAHRAEHPERARAHLRAWRKRNPQAVRAHNDKRKARLRGATTAELVDRQEIFDRDRGRCHLCGRFVARKAFTLDHLVPLVLGGAHTPGNVKLAHRACNSRKGARFIST